MKISVIATPTNRILEELKSIHYDGIDLIPSRHFSMPRDLDQQARRDLKAKINSYNLEIAGLTLATHPSVGLNPVSSIPPERAESKMYAEECIRLARDFDVKVCVYQMGYFHVNMSKDVMWKWNRDALKELSKTAEDMDVVLAMEFEPLPGNSLHSADDIVNMIKEVDSANVRANLDTGHVNILERSGSIVDFVEKLDGNIAHTHLNDNDGSIDTHSPPGTGNIDWRILLSSLRKAGYSGWFTGEYGYSLKNAAQSKEVLEKALKYIGGGL